MKQTEQFLKEMQQEAATTAKMLSRIPEDKYSWKPHEKSMEMQQLATHIAELPTWVKMALETDELDFNANAYEPKKIKNNKELMQLFEDSLAEGKEALKNANDNLLPEKWILRSGDIIHSNSEKREVIRMAFSQIVHHRAQLGVYLRLLNDPIPGSYGPSADDQNF